MLRIRLCKKALGDIIWCVFHPRVRGGWKSKEPRLRALAFHPRVRGGCRRIVCVEADEKTQIAISVA